MIIIGEFISSCRLRELGSLGSSDNSVFVVFCPVVFGRDGKLREMILFVVGIILLLLEIFVIPGFGVTGGTGNCLRGSVAGIGGD